MQQENSSFINFTQSAERHNKMKYTLRIIFCIRALKNMQHRLHSIRKRDIAQR